MAFRTVFLGLLTLFVWQSEAFNNRLSHHHIRPTVPATIPAGRSFTKRSNLQSGCNSVLYGKTTRGKPDEVRRRAEIQNSRTVPSSPIKSIG
jgi:hypothetical protein